MAAKNTWTNEPTPEGLRPARQRFIGSFTRRCEELTQLARFPCRTAVDGQDALDQMIAEMPDVLILDLSMPRLDGLQVLEALAARGGPLPRTIVISANRREDDVRRALSMGAQDYVVKPFNPLILLARVRRLLA